MLKVMLRRNSTKNNKQITSLANTNNLPEAPLLANNKSNTYETFRTRDKQVNRIEVRQTGRTN